MEQLPEDCKNYFIKIDGAMGMTLKITRDQAQTAYENAYYLGIKTDFKVSPQNSCFLYFSSPLIDPIK